MPPSIASCCRCTAARGRTGAVSRPGRPATYVAPDHRRSCGSGTDQAVARHRAWSGSACPIRRPASGAAGARRRAGTGPLRRSPFPRPRPGSSGGCRSSQRGGPGRTRTSNSLAVRSTGVPRTWASWWTRSRSSEPTVIRAGGASSARLPVTQRRPDPGFELGHAEGLGHVVVRPAVEGGHLAILGAAGRQDDDGTSLHWRILLQTDWPSMSGRPRSSTTMSGEVSAVWRCPARRWRR